jgi:hypothetical protein
VPKPPLSPKPAPAPKPVKAVKPPKSEKPSDLWNRFKLETAKLAKTLAIPQAYTLEKVREKGKKRGDAWKDFEREVTRLFVAGGFTQAERISRGDDLGASDVDILVPENPLLKVDTKYQVDGWSVLTLFEKTEEKYVAKHSSEFLVMPLKAGGTAGSVSVIRTEKLIALLATSCLRDGAAGHAMSCPVCPGAVAAIPLGKIQAHCECSSCGFEFQAPAASVPPAAWTDTGSPAAFTSPALTQTLQKGRKAA